MSENLPATVPTPEPAGGRIQMDVESPLVATYALSPETLAAGHASLAEWFELKVKEMEEEFQLHEAAFQQAKKNRWSYQKIQHLRNLAEKRRNFYVKCADAIRAGYVIVPNFAMDVVMVRTSKGRPEKWADAAVAEKSLPPGEGKMQAATVIPVSRWVPGVVDRTVTPPRQVTDGHYTRDYQEFGSIEFPIELSKPEILEKTSEAAEKLIFDEIGVARDQVKCDREHSDYKSKAKSVDPIILGRIKNPDRKRPDLSCFIAWAFDPRGL